MSTVEVPIICECRAPGDACASPECVHRDPLVLGVRYGVRAGMAVLPSDRPASSTEVAAAAVVAFAAGGLVHQLRVVGQRAERRASPLSAAKPYARCVISEDVLRGRPGLSRAVIAALVRRQPRTVAEALAIPGVGRKTTRHLLSLGLLTDPESVQGVISQKR